MTRLASSSRKFSIRKAREGVRVYVLYDEIGSYYLPKAYRRELAAAGVVDLAVSTSRGLRNRFQVNFRNHRKIVIVDGEVAYVGGLECRRRVHGPQQDIWSLA